MMMTIELGRGSPSSMGFDFFKFASETENDFDYPLMLCMKHCRRLTVYVRAAFS